MKKARGSFQSVTAPSGGGNMPPPVSPVSKAGRSSASPNFAMLAAVSYQPEVAALIQNFSEGLNLSPAGSDRILVLSQTEEPKELAEGLIWALTENLYLSPDAVYQYGDAVPADPGISVLNHLLDLKLRRRKDGLGCADFELLFDHLADPGDVHQAWLRQNLQRLRPLSPELRETFASFSRHNLSPGDTAAALFIHRNTLKYRLDRLHQQTDIDPRSHHGAALLNLLLAAECRTVPEE